MLLMKAVSRLIEIDDFMAGLWKVHLAVKSEGYAQVNSDLLPASDLLTDHPAY